MCVCIRENEKMFHDAPVSAKKWTSEDLSVTKIKGLFTAAPLLHSSMP